MKKCPEVFEHGCKCTVECVVEMGGAGRECRSDGCGCRCSCGCDRRCGRSVWLMTAIAVMAAIIVGLGGKLCYGCGYGAMSTVPCWMWFFVDTGARVLEKGSLVFVRCRGIGSP